MRIFFVRIQVFFSLSFLQRTYFVFKHSNGWIGHGAHNKSHDTLVFSVFFGSTKIIIIYFLDMWRALDDKFYMFSMRRLWGHQKCVFVYTCDGLGRFMRIQFYVERMQHTDLIIEDNTLSMCFITEEQLMLCSFSVFYSYIGRHKIVWTEWNVCIENWKRPRFQLIRLYIKKGRTIQCRDVLDLWCVLELI